MKALSLVIFVLSFCEARSQQLPSFRQLRYEEDYSSLRNDTSHRRHPSIKYLSLSRNGNTWLSMGGDIRYQYQWFRNENWGKAIADKDGFLLTRYLVHSDLHLGAKTRFFVQLQSSLANGKETSPSPVEENQLDLHQAFADVVFVRRGVTGLTLRVGRQELLYGSQRLISVRDGPNNRQSFDAARMIFSDGYGTADLFFSHFVRSKQRIFDDGFNNNVKLWGAYLVRNKVPLVRNADLYYLGLHKSNAVFADGIGRELRHSIGSRLWNTSSGARYDVEGLYQFGDLAGKAISAWTISVNAGYKFNSWKCRPELAIKTELISGDAISGDGHLNTFNPLFPRGGYFGLVSLIGPSNLFDIHPSIALNISPATTWNFDCDLFWRYSRQDGIYQPNVALIYDGSASKSLSIGRQYSTDIVYTPNRFLYLRGEFTFFKAGQFLREAGPGKNILFAAATIQYRF
ncbi:MAG: alginate export family protein [Chitinophagaceae bacterium]